MGAIDMWRRGAARRPGPAEWLAALALLLLSLAAAAVVAWRTRHRMPTLDFLHPGLVAVTVLSTVAFLIRVRRPKGALALAVACGVGYAGLGYALNPVLILPLVITLFAVAVATDRRTAVLSAGITASVLIAAEMAVGPGSWTEPLKLSILAWSGMAAAAGDAVRSRRAYVSAVEERAERAERTREQEARRRVAEDRIRIARELHDVVAHHIALINAQAGVVVHLMEDLPEPVRTALEHIRDTSHEALQELKATVGLLRQSDDPSAPLEPSPGLDQLPELLASFARAGLDVELQQGGDVRPLPPAVDLTAYRILQESLTNVRKHAGVPSARVRLFFSEDQLAIRVEDRGRTAQLKPWSNGHGLTGMRERASVVGGTLTAGRDPWGGFRVTADLPLRSPGNPAPPTAPAEAAPATPVPTRGTHA
jgi:signal transduction histidine kinase